MKFNKILLIFGLTFVLFSFDNKTTEVGAKIDSYNKVAVYYNGHNFTNVIGRSVAPDGYNLGLKYQCVEFVKRYYYEVFGHKMTNSYGHAKDFFDKKLGDRAYNVHRGLMQYRNVREYKPAVNDILVYDGYPGNRFGHVAIISKVTDEEIEIVQQNIGSKSRIKIPLVNFYQYWTIADYNILGWLRKE
ncbi:MAG: CHAP domain-containing protein [Saprospiraceae bacterium]|nr:CHAP domain-containing protein [Saprospiraceae bacterium]